MVDRTPLLTIGEVANGLRMKPRNVRELIRSGQLKAHDFGGEVLVEETAVGAYLEDNTLYPDQDWDG